MSLDLSLNKKLLPGISIFFIGSLGLLFLGVVTLHIVNGFGDITLLAGIPAVLLAASYLMTKTTRLVNYSSYPDYLEFTSAHLLVLDSFHLKRYSQRLVKSHVEEITIKGYFFWKRIKVHSKSDSGRRYTATIPLRFISNYDTARILEDIAGVSLEDMWEADYARDTAFDHNTQAILSGS